MKQCKTKKLLSLSMSSKACRTTPNVLNCHFLEEPKADHSVKLGMHPPHFFLSYHPRRIFYHSWLSEINSVICFFIFCLHPLEGMVPENRALVFLSVFGCPQGLKLCLVLNGCSMNICFMNDSMKGWMGGVADRRTN